jgi:integrase/recombinase XerC
MLKEKFLEYFKSERNCSDQTITSYGTDLTEFEKFFESLHEGITWTSVTESVVREWMIYLFEGQKMKSASVNRKLSTLRSFYHYLIKIGELKVNPMTRITGPKKEKVLPVFIREKEMDRLIDMLEEDKSYEGLLNKTVVLMLYLTGIRRAELLGLEDGDVDFVNKQIKVTGKRNKQRIIPFGKELEDCMREYLESRFNEFGRGFEKFFIDTKGFELSKSRVESIVKSNLSKVTTQQRRSPHVLRHTFATAMLNHDADLMSIQKLLGHTSLNTTQVYTHVSFEELKKTYQNAHPRS